MNEGHVKQSLKDLVLNNENMLMADLIHQGQQRQIVQVALSNLTPPQGYYYILVYITGAREFSRLQSSVTQRPTAAAEYDIQIEVADEALVQQEDIFSEAYQTMALDFDKFTDRLVTLIREQNWIGDEPKLKVKRGTGESDRRVEKVNQSGNYLNTEQNEVASLNAAIQFTLIEECVDTTGLYS